MQHLNFDRPSANVRITKSEWQKDIELQLEHLGQDFAGMIQTMNSDNEAFAIFRGMVFYSFSQFDKRIKAIEAALNIHPPDSQNTA